MKVHIPGPLRSYTAGLRVVEVKGETLADLFLSLDDAFPGLRFRIVDEQDRIREHIKIFVDSEQHKELSFTVNPRSEVQIVCALSGGLDCVHGRIAPIMSCYSQRSCVADTPPLQRKQS